MSVEECEEKYLYIPYQSGSGSIWSELPVVLIVIVSVSRQQEGTVSSWWCWFEYQRGGDVGVIVCAICNNKNLIHVIYENKNTRISKFFRYYIKTLYRKTIFTKNIKRTFSSQNAACLFILWTVACSKFCSAAGAATLRQTRAAHANNKSSILPPEM